MAAAKTGATGLASLACQSSAESVLEQEKANPEKGFQGVVNHAPCSSASDTLKRVSLRMGGSPEKPLSNALTVPESWERPYQSQGFCEPCFQESDRSLVDTAQNPGKLPL